MLNNEETKEYGVNELTPKEEQTENKDMKQKNSSNKTVKKNSSKKNSSKKKMKPINWVILVFVAIVAVVMIYVWNVSRHNGPVYGNRCEGMPAISETAISSTIADTKASNESISDLKINVNCKTIKIDIEMAEGYGQEEAVNAAAGIILDLDTNVGLTKSNTDSLYSDLLTATSEKDSTKYHVDITIKGSGEAFPIFASKHPSSDEVNYTFNVARDPELVEKLYEQQAEEETTEE